MAQFLTKGRASLLFAAIFALLAFAFFAIPMYVIWPFRHQGAGELSIALFLRQVGPALSLVCAIVCALFVAFTFTRSRTWLPRTAAVLTLLLAIASAYLTRIDMYEFMFHHLDVPQFEAAARAHLASDDMVIAIRVKGLSHAYPIREVAYHHVVNDTLEGVPIVATY